MQTSQTSNLPMLSKTYMTANLMDLSNQPMRMADGQDPLQYEKGSPMPDGLYESKFSPTIIPLMGKATKLKKRLTSNLALSKMKKKNLDVGAVRIDDEAAALKSETIETRVRGSLRSREQPNSRKDGKSAEARGQSPEASAAIYQDAREFKTIGKDRSQARSNQNQRANK